MKNKQCFPSILLVAIIGVFGAVNVSAQEADVDITTDTSEGKGSFNSIYVGQELKYLSLVVNHGPEIATNVVLTDNLPNELKLLSVEKLTSEGSVNGDCTGMQDISCNLGSLPVGDGVYVVITTEVIKKPKGGGILVNRLAVSATEDDPQTLNNTDGATLTVVKGTPDPVDQISTDLFILVKDAPDPVIVNDQLVFNVGITNLGPEMALNSVLAAELGTQTAAGVYEGGTCIDNGIISCALGTLARNESRMVKISTIPTVAALLSTIFTISSDTPELDGALNSRLTSTLVVPPAEDMDIAVTLTDSPDPIKRRGELLYTVTVTNNGPGLSSSVEMIHALPSDVEYVSLSSTSPSTTSCHQKVTAPVVVSCIISTLGSGQSAVFETTVKPLKIGNIDSTVSVSGNGTDINVGNETDSASTLVTR